MAAQEDQLRFINFGTKEGLTDNFAYNATQDHRGFMWFATASGLYRYDGHSFKIYRSPLDKPGRAIANILQTVYAAKNGTIWLGGFNTLQWYDPAKNIFSGPDYDNSLVKKLCNAYILNFTEDHNNMWIASSNDYFFKFTSADSSFKYFGNIFPANASKTTIRVVIASNSIWAIHPEGVYQFSPEEKFSGYYPFAGDNISNGIYDAVSNSLLLTTYNSGLIRFSVENKIFDNSFAENSILKTSNLFCINNADADNTWIGSFPLFRFDKQHSSLSFFGYKNSSEYDLKTSKIGSLFLDREKNLWICGYAGLSMLPWQNQQIKTTELTDKTSGVTVEPVGVYNIVNTSNLVFANTNTNGLIYYDGDSGQTSTVQNNFVTDKNAKRIISVVPGPDGNMYASDDVHFFKVLHKEKKLALFPLHDQSGKPIVSAGRSVADKKGNVYISSINNGFYIWNTTNNKLTHYNKWDADTSISANTDNVLYPCLADSDDNIWFTGSSGVYELKTAENKFYHHAFEEYKDIPLLTTSEFIAQDKMGHYWISTNNNGLYELYFERGKERLKNYTQIAKKQVSM